MNTFDEIIQTKAYSDLTSNELEIVRELVSSEEEYNEMKSFYAEIDQLAISSREEVSISVKSSLNSVFQAKHPGISQNWNATAEPTDKKIIPFYNRTLFRAAALLVLSAGVVTIWVSMSDNQLVKESRMELTANETAPLKEEKAAPKKEFPLNDAEKQKEFTAASEIPKDENVDQNYAIQSNAVSTTSVPSASLRDLNKEKTVGSVSLTPAAGSTTYSFSTKSTSTHFYLTMPSAKPGKQNAGNSQQKRSESDDKKDSFTKAGLNADLNPGGFYTDAEAGSLRDYKPSIKTADLLTLIEPSF